MCCDFNLCVDPPGKPNISYTVLDKFEVNLKWTAAPAKGGKIDKYTLVQVCIKRIDCFQFF